MNGKVQHCGQCVNYAGGVCQFSKMGIDALFAESHGLNCSLWKSGKGEAVVKASTFDSGAEGKINSVLAWAQNKPDFDTTFVKSLGEGLAKYKKLTDPQAAALEKIISKFRIPLQ